MIRHFKVNSIPPKDGMNTSDYLKWIETYNKGDIIVEDVDLKNIEWDRCYSSDMKRAFLTAEEIFDDPVISTHLLREVEIQPSIDVDIKKDYDFWKRTGSEAWKNGDESQIESIEDTRKRVNAFLDFIKHKEDEDSNILIVFHIIIMRIFEEELKKRGFKGELNEDPLNGKIYVFEK